MKLKKKPKKPRHRIRNQDAHYVESEDGSLRRRFPKRASKKERKRQGRRETQEG